MTDYKKRKIWRSYRRMSQKKRLLSAEPDKSWKIAGFFWMLYSFSPFYYQLSLKERRKNASSEGNYDTFRMSDGEERKADRHLALLSFGRAFSIRFYRVTLPVSWRLFPVSWGSRNQTTTRIIVLNHERFLFFILFL